MCLVYPLGLSGGRLGVRAPSGGAHGRCVMNALQKVVIGVLETVLGSGLEGLAGPADLKLVALPPLCHFRQFATRLVILIAAFVELQSWAG